MKSVYQNLWQRGMLPELWPPRLLVADGPMRGSGMNQQHTDLPGHYEIRLKGTLPQYWSRWFGDMTITCDGEGNTLLHGPIVDQAALHGLLDKARDLGLALLEVRRAPQNPGFRR